MLITVQKQLTLSFDYKHWGDETAIVRYMVGGSRHYCWSNLLKILACRSTCKYDKFVLASFMKQADFENKNF